MGTNTGLLPANETERLAALRRYNILDTPPDGTFDRIVAMAAKILDVPIALVSLVDHDRIWFKARHGLDAQQVSRDPGLCASVILRDEVYVVNDARIDPRTLANPLVVGELGLRFYAAAPLQTKDGYNLGTLCVIDKEPRQLSEQQKQILAELAGIVMDEMELRLVARKVVETEEHVQVLKEIMRIATSTLDIAEVFEQVGEQVKQLIDNDWLDIAVPAPSHDHLQIYACTAGPPGMLNRKAKVPLDTSPGEVIRTGRPIVLKNLQQESSNLFELAVAEEKGLHSVMFVPLNSKGRVIGSLNFGSCHLSRYGEEELHTAQEIADHLAVVLEHALFNKQLLRQTEEFSFLNTISTALDMTVDISELLDLVLEQIIALTEMEGGAVLLVDEDTQRLTLNAERNLPLAAKDLLLRHPIAVGEFIPGITAQRCQLFILENAKDDERELPPLREAGVRTHVCIPLVAGGRALGVLGMTDREDRSFSPGELALFTTAGEQLGTAIERTRLFESQARLAQRVQTLNELMQIAVSSLDINQVCDRLGEQVKRLIDHDRLSITLHQTNNSYLDVYALTPGATPIFSRGTRLPLHESASGEVVLSGRPILRRKIPEDAVYPSEVTLARETGLRSMMYIPLESKGRVIGSINIASLQEARYSEKELQIAREVAAHLAVILEHTLLYKETRELAERLQTLNELMHITTSTLNKDEAFSRIEEQMKQLINYDRFSFALRPPGADYLEMYPIAPESQYTFPKGARPSLQTPMGEAILTGRPLIRRTPADFTYLLELEMHQAGGYNSAMFVPLKSKGRVVGSMNLGSNREDNFSEKELQVAQRIAEHMSVVVENAVLYEESKQSEETLRRLNKQLEEANRHKSEFLANMSHELRSPLNTILGVSELLGDELFGPLNQKQAEYIQDIHQCGNHLLSLINDVLDLSKVEAGKLDLDLNFLRLHSLMESSATIVRERAASKSLEFQVLPPAEDIVFEADERKIKQIIYNLLSNAVKFTPEQGKVTFSARREGNAVVFVVEDTGPGVAREWQERIFEEFVQAPGSREGTGLGLAVSKKLVELHGGCIWLESQVGQGSRFFFTIPIREEAAARSQGLGISQ